MYEAGCSTCAELDQTTWRFDRDGETHLYYCRAYGIWRWWYSNCGGW